MWNRCRVKIEDEERRGQHAFRCSVCVALNCFWCLANPPFLRVMLLLLFSYQPVGAEMLLSNCSTDGTTLVTANYIVNASCTSVALSNMVVQGAILLNVSISGIAAANPGSPWITVTISNMTLQAGAVLAIDSRDYTAAGGRDPMVSIMIQSMIGSDGCLVFLGSFPPGTSILVRNARMVSSTAAAPQLSSFDPYESSSRHKMVMLINVSLISSSSMIFANSSLAATSADTAIDSFCVTGSAATLFSNDSALVLQNCSISTSHGDIFGVWSTAVAFIYSSYLLVNSCRMTAAGGSAFYMPSIANFTWSSFVAFLACDMTATLAGGYAFRIVSAVSFTNSSFLAFTLSNMTSLSGGNAVVMNGALAFTSNSYLAVTSCNVTAVRGSAFVTYSGVNLTGFSYVSVTSSEMSAGGGGDTFRMNGGPIVVAQSSYVILSSCNMVSGRHGITFDPLSFSDSSNLTVELCNITSQGYSIAFSNSVSLSSSSSWTFVRCILRSAVVAVGLQSKVSFENSTWRVDSCSIFGLGGLGLSSAIARLTQRSVWEVTNTVFSANSIYPPYGALILCQDVLNSSAVRSSLEIRDMSVWSFVRCTFSAMNTASAVLLSKSDVTVANGSVWSAVDCTGTSVGTGGSITFAASTLTIEQSSEFKILRSAFRATSSPALFFTAKSTVKVHNMSAFVIENGTLQGSSNGVLTSKDCPVRVDGISAWVISGVLLISSGVPIQLDGGVTGARSSMFTLRANTLQMFGGTCCVDVRALSLSDWGSAQAIDNDCDGSNEGAPFLAPSSEGYSGLVERCNRVNGAVWRPLKLSTADYRGISSLQCGRCDRTVDCFWPLTAAAELSKIVCADDDREAARNCPCLALCGGDRDLMCLPGVGTAAADGSVLPSFCTNEKKPRLQWTLTATANGTLSKTFTHSTSVQGKASGISVRALPALHDATVAFASTAVLLSGPTGAGMMQRMQAQQLLNSCGGGGGWGSMDFSSSPTQMQLGPDDRSMSYVRGSVVGNLLIWLACVAVACVVCKIVTLRRASDGPPDSSWETVAAELGLPGRLFWPYSMLSVPTLTSSTMLLVPYGIPRTVRPGDVALGALGVGVCTTAAACVVFFTTGWRFRATATLLPSHGQAEPDLDKRGVSLFMRCKKWAQLELSSRWEWVDRRRARGFVKRWGALFDAYCKGRQWFGVVELGASAATAVLAGLVPLDGGNGGVCQDLQVLSAIAAVAYLASVVLLRPYGSPMEGRLALFTAVATSTSSVLGVLGVDTMILTAVQAILTAVSTLSSVVVLATDGTLTQWMRGLSSVVLQKRRTVTNSAEICDNSREMLAPLLQAERTKVLAELLWMICENRQPNVRGQGNTSSRDHMEACSAVRLDGGLFAS